MDANVSAFLAVAALVILTPGPDTALVIKNALLYGRRAALATSVPNPERVFVALERGLRGLVAGPAARASG